jgi:hypothetical protein
MADDLMPSELQDKFEWAALVYKRWRSGPEPTTAYEKKICSMSLICDLVEPYENVPLRPGVMSHLLAIADARHSDLKAQLVDNYGSAAKYLHRLIQDRADWHRRRGL